MKVTMRRAFLGTMMVWACVIGNTRTGWVAESSRFLVSYGGTAGYQLPLWVNKELGFSKKYGVGFCIDLFNQRSVRTALCFRSRLVPIKAFPDHRDALPNFGLEVL